MVAVVLVAPVIQLILLGYAVNMEVKSINTAVLDYDLSSKSRELIRSFESSGYFVIKNYPKNYNELTKEIDKGNILVAIVIPNDFEKNIGNNKTATLQTILDGSDGNKASIAAGYVQGIVSEFSQNILTEMLQRNGVISPVSGTFKPEVRIWFNPNLTTRHYMIPSIVGLLLMLITTSLTSLAIVKEREIGTLEQLIVTPIKPVQMILGKLIPFTILGLIAATIVLGVMRYWFGIEIRGSIALLYFCSLIFMISSLGLGMFVSTIAKTQSQAMITSSFLIIMPMIFLSGFSFPIESMPMFIQYITYAIPMRYFIIILRGIILKGVGIEFLWKEILYMFSIGVIILTLSALRFRKRLE